MATQRANTRAEGFIYLGLASLNLGQQHEAEQAFRQALLLEPRSAQAHYNLGLIYSSQNKRSEAIQELKQAVTLAPRHLDGLYNLGVLLLERNDALEAAHYLERAAQLGPASVELSANLIRAYLGAGKSEQALKQAQLDSSRFERSPEFHLALGNAFLAHNFPVPARAYLEKASRQVPAMRQFNCP